MTTASPTTRIWPSSPSISIALERSSAAQVRNTRLAPEAVSKASSRRVFQRPLVEAARFEPCGDTAGNAGPARDAIERMPAVIEQDAAARQRRINPPVCDSILAGGGRGLSSQRPPPDGSDGADRAFVDQRRNPEANRGLQPIVNRV